MSFPITATVLFDSFYLEPALVTAHELIEQLDNEDKLFLVYLTRGDESELEDLVLIQAFCDRFCVGVDIHAITLRNTLAEFSACHFNNAILYKALLPLAINYEPYLVNFDAGILLGGRFRAFWQQLKQDLLKDDGRWVIGAHCHDPADMLPPALCNVPHSPLYPAGNLLLFHVRRYLALSWQHRFLANYTKFMPYLNYAEQELICLTAVAGEIIALPGADERITPFLGMDVLLQQAAPLMQQALRDCLFFKFVGSLKPWKYWVLDPNKSLYLGRRAVLEAKFPLTGIRAIERHRVSQSREDWAPVFLRAYDAYLATQSTLRVNI